MDIFINNEKTEVHPDRKLNDLLSDLKIATSRGIAVAINNQVIPKSKWEEHFIKENDHLTIIKATQGG